MNESILPFLDGWIFSSTKFDTAVAVGAQEVNGGEYYSFKCVFFCFQLVGIVKLSLHQFYMSFRDKRICSALLKSQVCIFLILLE